jgi:hypothetical protein
MACSPEELAGFGANCKIIDGILALSPGSDDQLSDALTSSSLPSPNGRSRSLAAPARKTAPTKTAPTKTAPADEKRTRAPCAICHTRPFRSKRLFVHLCQHPGKPTDLLCYECVSDGTKADRGRYRWHDTISFRGVDYRPQADTNSHKVVLHGVDDGRRCCDWAPRIQ